MVNLYSWNKELRELRLPPELFTFPGGEWHFNGPAEPLSGQNPDALLAVLTGCHDDDIVKTALWGTVAKQFDAPFYIIAPYLPAARADRGVPLGISAYADLLLATNPARVISVDVHNPGAASRVYGDTLVMLDSAPFVEKVYVAQQSADRGFMIDAVIAPDQGAADRATRVAERLEVPVHSCVKKRDFGTGKILDLQAPDLDPSKSYLVVDDICDGGGTFRLLASRLGVPRENLTLWVTHGIFSGKADELREDYARIWTTRSHSGWNRLGCATSIASCLAECIQASGINWYPAHHAPIVRMS